MTFKETVRAIRRTAEGTFVREHTMDRHTVRMVMDKETKNTIRFEENTADGKPPVIGTLYVPKWVVGSQQAIDVTIEPAADSATLPKGSKK